MTHSGDDKGDDPRVKLLEFQVDHLRAELELLKRRHAEAVYSVAWHIAWPARMIERSVRKYFARKSGRMTAPESMAAETPEIKPPDIETCAPSAAQIAADIKRRAGAIS